MKNLLPSRFLLLIVISVLYSCSSDDTYIDIPDSSVLEHRIIQLYGSKQALILPLSDDYSSIPSDINNPLTPEKIALGRLLFHETGLATVPVYEDAANTYSCASCHHVDAGFQSGIKQGIGEGGIGFGISGEGRHKNSMYQEADLDVQPIRSPTILNVAYQDVMLWNGQFGGKGTNEGTNTNWTPGTPKEHNNLGFEGVEIQAVAGMGVHRLDIDLTFITNSSYKALFDAAFPNVAQDQRYSNLNAALAIAAYERTLLPNQAPFQQWLQGDNSALNDDETQGALLFFGKANCFSCHSGPGLNSMSFHALGMNDLEGNGIATTVDEATKKGRGGFTNNPDDDYKFKTPQLYNLKGLHFFGHGGSLESLADVVNYKNNAISENTEVPNDKLSSLFVPLNLTNEEMNQMVAFLENALYDADLYRYVPESLPSGNCFPNADEMSSMDLGCN